MSRFNIFTTGRLHGFGATLLLVLAMMPSNLRAGAVWTDGNGDGLPDPLNLTATISDNLTADIWIDTQSFTFTSFGVWIEHDAILGFVTGGYHIVGGSIVNSAIFTPMGEPSKHLFAGSGYSHHGVKKLCWITVHKDAAGKGCVLPMIDEDADYYSALINSTNYMLFMTRTGSCWQEPSTATMENSWGQVKGLYR